MTGITTVGELVAAAKAKPNQLKFGSTGMGTGSQLGIEKFNIAAGLKAAHVPARAGEAIADTIANTVAGRTDYLLAPIQLALVEIHAGRLRPLGVSTMKRSSCCRKCRASQKPASPASTIRFGMAFGRLPALLQEWWIDWRRTSHARWPRLICASGLRSMGSIR
jgi:hypothetical protein